MFTLYFPRYFHLKKIFNIFNFILFTGLPHEISVMWYHYPYPFNEAVCVIQGFAAETSSNATVLTITAFTIERYNNTFS